MARIQTSETSPSPSDHKIVRGHSEWERLILLGVIATWLLHPYATARQIGSGDALWYANMLADFVTQWRAGHFPVFVGQTEFAFNGAVYPLRVAPLYQHLAGLLDLLTGRQLTWFALQHLCVIVCGVAGIYACYFALAKLAPTHRWSAAFLAILYLSCPGVLGTIYTQDLYMTWMTVPFIPLVFYGAIRAFQQDDLTAQVLLATALAALWLAHAPVALWATLLATAFQAIRLVSIHRRIASVKRVLAGGLLFALLAHYPFVSVAALQTPGATSSVTGGLDRDERISNVVQEVFPAVLLPLSEHARALSDLQLGYGLWLVLLAAVASAAFARSWALGALLGGVALLLALLLPVPGNAWLWAHLPDQIKRITFYWPMHRFYLLLAGLLAIAGQLALAALARKKENEREGKRTGERDSTSSNSSPPIRPFSPTFTLTFALTLMFALACVWSLYETRQFIRAGNERTAPSASSALRQRPENLLLMNHAYGLFSALPAYFSNGAMDPRSETRLLARDTLQPLPVVASAKESGWFRGSVDANPGILNLEPSLRLKPGQRYALTFHFARPHYQGVLQLMGHAFFREYALPFSGETRAFGSGPSAGRELSLWTTDPDGDEITLRFIPSAPGATPADFVDFAQYQLREIDPAAEPVEVTSLAPFRAQTRASTAGWLETPRMAQPGYVARIDGLPVENRRSPQGLVMLPIEPGTHEVELSFRGPLALRAAYWTTLTAWIGLLVGVAFVAIRSRKNPQKWDAKPR